MEHDHDDHIGLGLVITHISRMARNDDIMTVIAPEMSGD
jgi:hypothetical protein